MKSSIQLPNHPETNNNAIPQLDWNIVTIITADFPALKTIEFMQVFISWPYYLNEKGQGIYGQVWFGCN